MRISLLIAHLLAVAVLVAACSNKTSPAADTAPPKEAKQNSKTVWIMINPIQCGFNPWEKMKLEIPLPEDRAAAEEKLVRTYMSNMEVKVRKYTVKQTMENTCAACSCPRGDTMWLEVDKDGHEAALDAGWKLAEGEGQGAKEEPKSTETAWIKINPIQCGNNAWEKFEVQGAVPKDPAEAAKMRLHQYMESIGAPMLRFSVKVTMEYTCEACTCPNGETVWAEIDRKNLEAAIAAGWTHAEGEGL